MLVKTNDLPIGYQVVEEMDYIFSQQKLFIITSESDLIFLEKKPSPYPDEEDEPDGILLFQTEFPLGASGWIVDVIENRLWKSEEEGGLPSGINFVKEDVDGETLKIRRAMNVSGPGEKGFNFFNLSRKSLHFDTEDYQEIQITDELLLAGGLLGTLKSISAQS